MEPVMVGVVGVCVAPVRILYKSLAVPSNGKYDTGTVAFELNTCSIPVSQLIPSYE